MKRTLRSLIISAAALLLLTLTACTVSLAEDITPPPDYTPSAGQQPTTAQVSLPLVPPDPAAGASIFAEKCAPCHGAAGQGDGPQASQLPNIPAAIGKADVARAARPADWFAVVTNGNLQKFMPGFSGSLDDRQRWDVVSYVYTLSASPDDLAQGKGVYAEQCQSCHGATGKGDGSAAQGKLPDWTEPGTLAQLSGQELHDLIASGTQNGMPAYQGKLDDAKIWAVSDYTRSLSFGAASPSGQQAQAAGTAQPQPGAPAGTPAAAGTPQAAAVEGKATITGTVINASGGLIPPDMRVTLQGYDSMQPAFTQDTDVDLDGNFTFENVDTNPNRVFMATVKYKGYTFNSDILHATDIKPGAENKLNVHIYESGTDASALVADRMHVFFDFSKPGVVQVGELFIISNPGSTMVVPAKAGEPVLRFELPKGATNLNFQDGSLGDRFVQTDNGFGDTQSIPPGSGQYQVLFAYDLPYSSKLDVTLVPPLPVTAAVLIGPSNGVRLSGSQLTDAGVQSMQDVQVHLYTAANLAASSKLDISLSGAPNGGLSQSSLMGVLIGLGALVLALAVVAVWYVRRRNSQLAYAGPGEDESPAENGSPDSLLDAIVALDDLYQSGQIPQDAYEKRRAELKNQLREATGGSQSS